MPVKNQCTSLQTSQSIMNIDKFLATFFFEIARNLSISIWSWKNGFTCTVFDGRGYKLACIDETAVGEESLPMAEEMAVINRANAATRERIFFGALEKPYSSDVMEAKISEIAINTYAPVCVQTLMSTLGH